MAKDAVESSTKLHSEDTIAVLLAANGVTTVSMKSYEIMSSLDGTRTASGFQHQFRAILKKAKELKGRMDNGETFAPVTPAKKKGADSMDGHGSPTPTPSKKRGSKSMGEDSTPRTPVKRMKTTAKPKLTPKSAAKATNGSGAFEGAGRNNEESFAHDEATQNFFEEAAAFHPGMIKTENEWAE